MNLRIFFCLYLFCFSFNHINCQIILDNDEPHVIMDWLHLDGVDYRVEYYNRCRNSSLIIEEAGSIETFGLSGFVHESAFDFLDNEWVLLSNLWAADDIADPSLELKYRNLDGEIETIVFDEIDYEFHPYQDFCIYKQGTILIKASCYPNCVNYLILNLDGSVQYLGSDNEFEKLDFAFDNLFGFRENNVFILDDSLEVINGISVQGNYRFHKFHNDKIYLSTDEKLIVLDTELNILNESVMNENIEIADLTVHGDTIFYLANPQQDQSILHWYLNDVNNGILAEENFQQIEFNRFPKGDFSTTVFGIQEWEENPDFFYDYPFQNSLISTYEKLGESTIDLGIELINTYSYSFPYDTFYIEALDSLFISYDYENFMDFNITNFSDEIIQNVFVVSQSFEGINCVDHRFETYYENLNLLPGETREFFAKLNSYSVPEEFCFYIISADGKYDTNNSNNRSCLSVNVGLNDIQNNEMLNQEVKVFPNPVSQYLNFILPKDFQLSEAVVINSDGKQQVFYSDSFTWNNKITVIDLPNGLYFLQLRSKDGKLLSGKFLKE